MLIPVPRYRNQSLALVLLSCDCYVTRGEPSAVPAWYYTLATCEEHGWQSVMRGWMLPETF